MMLVDSHCHINFPELAENLPQVLDNMQENQVSYALAVSVSRQTADEVLRLAETYPHIFASVGIHPADEETAEFSYDELIERSQHARVVAIGETGLDYHWCKGDLAWQHNRFRVHIQAAKAAGVPLIIHTREAPKDTIKILQEEKAENGVIHCFSEDTAFAKAALDLGFYISFSGIVTFKNAQEVQAACKMVPDDRILVETDAPYLAPAPHRGKLNQPAYTRHTAEFVANLRGMDFEQLGHTTTDNFFRLFHKAKRL
ncbi:MAG: TatD family hydrolase [Neisseriaceae bacterium]|nr:TatD family hydrolase [Neisseriaceae bacterium]